MRYIIAVLLLILEASSLQAQELALDAHTKAAIIALAQNEVKSGRTAGVAVGVMRGDRLVFKEGFGKANLETGTPLKTNTVFRIASVTKQFTASAVMLLANSGKLSLQDHLSKYFPAFPGAEKVTLSELLSHTSGIHDFTEASIPAEVFCAGSDQDAFLQRIVDLKPLYDFEPGTHYKYSNSGYYLLGLIIQKVTGTKYAVYMRQKLFAPVGMTHTEIDDNAEIVPLRASGYSLRSDGLGYKNATTTGMTIPFAAGAIRSTIDDLAKWNAAFFSGKVLPAASVALMTSSAKLSDGRNTNSGRWHPADQKPSQPLPAFIGPSDYGYGFDLSTFYGHPVIGHSGGIDGFNSMVRRYPDKGITVIVLANTDNGAWPLERAIATMLLK